ncbi:MAG: FliI/YscN family ATPase [Halanaerobium sp.]|nr:FliI/YscN family ATPase [Halanaerobium sp.]
MQMKAKERLTEAMEKLDNLETFREFGKIEQVIGLVLESRGPRVQVGELCEVHTNGRQPLLAEVVGFRENRILLMPLGEIDGVGPGSRVLSGARSLEVPVGPELLGKVLDGLGRPLGEKEYLDTGMAYPIHNSPPNPLTRKRITQPISLGIRSIDGLITCGRGQRMGIFSGSGVGKSTLLGMVARNTNADVNVIGLIGERGREVRDFLEDDLGPEGLARSVVVVATSDKPAMVRVTGALVTTAIAEYFRDQGKDVLLMMDSVTRVATALREVGLAIGEPPATRGYTPSVFARLPKLLERAGANDKGTITGLYAVLVEGDDLDEPVSDTVRGILDGHIVLSRKLATQNHYPAVDVLRSVSRVMPDIITR